MAQYDTIIVGAGSAGCVLANRLSEDTTKNILVLEAGPVDRNPLIHIPAAVYRVFKDPSINWNYLSTAQLHCDDRQIDLPRGKVIGGSSSINSMVYMRGHPKDYDQWSEQAGLEHWSYAQCLPYFKRCESSDRGASNYRGGSGPLGVSQSKLETPLYDAMLLAGEQSGQGTSDDLSGYKPEGIAKYDSTTRNGRRCSAATAHLKPALKRSNLTLQTGVLVQKILLENHRAVGVLVEHNDITQEIRAEQVIVSCGAIKTPQLLMLSGIGAADELLSQNIAVEHHLPGVGKNLQDHFTTITAFSCKQPVTLVHLSRPLQKLRAGAQWMLTRKGEAASNVWEMGGMVKSDHTVEFPDLEYHFAPVYSTYNGRKISLYQGFQLNVDVLRPFSRGTVKLASANPDAAPLSDFRYFDDPRDLEVMIKGYSRMQELLQQPAFDQFRGKRIVPAPDETSASDIEAYVRATASTDYHPCGTCKMGKGEDSVVDGNLKVHGIDGLYVVDASVMPEIVSGNLNAPVQMMAELASDLLAGKPLLEKEFVRFHFNEA